MLAALGTLPDGTKAVVQPVCYCGPIDRGEQVLKPLRSCASPIADPVQVMPYTAIQGIVENFNPRGLHNYWKIVYLKELEAIGIITEHYATVSAPHTHLVIYTLGGQVSRVSPDQTAVAYRDARHAVIAIGMWENPADDERQIQWVRDFAAAIEPFSFGAFYPNYDADTAADRVVAAFGVEKYNGPVACRSEFVSMLGPGAAHRSSSS